jgi:hypothetical protein
MKGKEDEEVDELRSEVAEARLAARTRGDFPAAHRIHRNARMTRSRDRRTCNAENARKIWNRR